jgi:two-component system, LytTR family, response regulator
MATESRITAMIVDDEKPARDRIRHLLAQELDIEVIADYGDAIAAAHAIEREPPDLLFLDVQMPELDGIRLLRRVQKTSGMHVIFVTAYEQYALTAFELDAADYLLKPFDPDRFAAAVDRVRILISQARDAADNGAGAGARTAGAARAHPDYIPVRSGQDIVLVRTESIDWIEAMGNYARLHVGRQTHMLRESMQKLEVLLDPARFARVHRSTIVNIERIARMRPMYHGDYEIVLTDGTKVMMSRGYKDRLRERWGKWL